MNWQNYRKLVDYLTEMRATRPYDFNYMQGVYLDKPGCVDCACRVLMGGTALIRGQYGGSIALFLGISASEAEQVWSPGHGDDVGVKAITRALDRLRKLAARYGGEPAQPDSPPQPTDAQTAAFLASVKHLIQQPLVETE